MSKMRRWKGVCPIGSPSMRTCAPTGRDRTLTKYTVSPGTAGAGDGEDADLLAVFLADPAAGPGLGSFGGLNWLRGFNWLGGLDPFWLGLAWHCRRRRGREFLSGLDRHSFHWRRCRCSGWLAGLAHFGYCRGGNGEGRARPARDATQAPPGSATAWSASNRLPQKPALPPRCPPRSASCPAAGFLGQQIRDVLVESPRVPERRVISIAGAGGGASVCMAPGGAAVSSCAPPRSRPEPRRTVCHLHRSIKPTLPCRGRSSRL